MQIFSSLPKTISNNASSCPWPRCGIFLPLKLIWAAQVIQIMSVSSKIYTVRVCLRVTFSTAAQQGNTERSDSWILIKKTSAELCIKDSGFVHYSLPFNKLYIGISSHSSPVWQKERLQQPETVPVSMWELFTYRHEQYEPILDVKHCHVHSSMSAFIQTTCNILLDSSVLDSSIIRLNKYTFEFEGHNWFKKHKDLDFPRKR